MMGCSCTRCSVMQWCLFGRAFLQVATEAEADRLGRGFGRRFRAAIDMAERNALANRVPRCLVDEGVKKAGKELDRLVHYISAENMQGPGAVVVGEMCGKLMESVVQNVYGAKMSAAGYGQEVDLLVKLAAVTSPLLQPRLEILITGMHQLHPLMTKELHREWLLAR